jgi:sialate O-acetylesterase
LDLSGQWGFNIGDNSKWSLPKYNDQNWEPIRVPNSWESQGFNGYDGYAWYRVHFDGRLLNKNESHFILLGYVDDVDETFVNGELVGRNGSFPPRYRTAYNSNRKYYIPSSTINFEGDNVIAIRVYDEQLEGGIIRGKPGIYVTKQNQELLQDLYGEWKFTLKNNDQYSNVSFDDSHWVTSIVPSHWDTQGFRSYDGTAWYRKHFKLSFKPDQETSYYLVLGKIDDFDVTYLNGVEIGSTMDGKRLGSSISYNQIRLYKIPSNLLQKENVIAVKVYDLGKEGGIYEGPIGIVPEEDITKVVRRGY